MNKHALLGIIAAVIAAGAAWYWMSPTENTSVSTVEDSAVRTFVMEFGSKFKNVSLLADNVSEQTAEQYGPYVTQELLAAWQSRKESAPGRYSSSPWPDRITIHTVTPEGAAAYVVEGAVIEVTSESEPQPAATYPITMRVEKRSENFVITNLSKGDYSHIPHRQSIVGYWECLPPKGDGPHTMECAFGIAVDQSDGHFAVNTMLMSTYPVDFPTGTKVRVTGVVTPANQLSSVQKYDIDGVISATTIEKL